MANHNTTELDGQFKKAFEAMEDTTRNIFITGKAGTGKSTLIDYFRSATRKKIVVLAPTGVAALNVQGETIHSFFGFKPDITQEKVKKAGKKKNTRLYKEIDAIIIDEISMVRADLLDCIDHFLRLKGKDSSATFGGLQMIFIGDLYQLPPVVIAKEEEIFKSHYESPYFFDAKVCKRDDFYMEFIELEKICRQKDETFIKLLNSIRNNTVTDEQLDELNSRLGVELDAASKDDFVINLTTTNKMANRINICRLQSLKTEIHTYEATILGDFKENRFPAEQELKVGRGAQVMLLNNDLAGRWVNGSIGRIVDIKRDEGYGFDAMVVQLSDGSPVEVLPYKWEIFHFSFNEERNAIVTESLGSFTQYPLRLAWAVTIHKSQGKTFDRVVIDIGSGTFADGQTYVALSRCTSLHGIALKRPVKKSDILVDDRVVKFLTKCKDAIPEADMPLEHEIPEV